MQPIARANSGLTGPARHSCEAPAAVAAPRRGRAVVRYHRRIAQTPFRSFRLMTAQPALIRETFPVAPCSATAPSSAIP